MRIHLLPVTIVATGLLSLLCFHSSYAQSPLQLPVYSGATPLNYVRVWNAKGPVSDANSLMNAGLLQVQQSTQYFDGLGRPLQTVVRKGSISTAGTAGSPADTANAFDLVTPVLYDEFGRQQYTFLSFAANTTGGNNAVSDGKFKVNPFEQQQTFLNNQYVDQGTDATYGYSQTVFEASPLNRVMEGFTPGTNWAGTATQTDEDNRHSTKQKYWVNTTADEVRIWEVTDAETGNWGSYSSTQVYPAGTLYKNVTLNENNKQVIEYKDKKGQIILKKAQLTAIVDAGGGSGHNGWLCNYFIYDDLGNIRCVIQPEGVSTMVNSNNWTLTTTLLNEQCFRYEYDGRLRQIIKKVPGAAEIFMVYDQRDRLVFMQDGILRTQNKWHTKLYDVLNRPVITGLISYSGSWAALQQIATQLTIVTEPGSEPTPNLPADLVLNGLTGSGTYLALNSILLEPDFENVDGAEILLELATDNGGTVGLPETSIDGVLVNYSPLPPNSLLDILTVSYYDNYEWANALNTSLKSFSSANANPYLHAASNSTFPYPQAVEASAATQGLVTGTKVKVLGSSPAQYLFALQHYDNEGRLIQTRSSNITGEIDVLTTQFSWGGLPVVTVQEHTKGNPNLHSATIVTQFSYDALNRLTKLEKKAGSSLVNNSVLPAAWATIVQNSYDAQGQTQIIKHGSKPGEQSTALISLDHTYNIRSWLTAINKDYLKGIQTTDRYFGMELGYDKNGFEGTYSPQFNGNISGMIWKNEGDQQKRKYDFSYDAVNRLTGALFGQYAGGAGTEAQYNTAAGVNFSVSNLQYDGNGNILSMRQMGLKGISSTLVDDLSYTYYEGTNRLKNVVDASNDAQTKLGDFRSSQLYLSELGGTKTIAAVDYSYDVAGNLVKDMNKDIDQADANGIEYNHLNLPTTIHVKNKGTIEYSYTATGVKLKKTVTDQNSSPAIITTTLYLNGIEYRNDTLVQISHEEGRIRFAPARESSCGPADARLVYDYYVKDHLGNVRMLLTEEESQDCYPAATVEPARVAAEKQLYNIVDSRIVARNSTGATETSLEEKVYRTHGGVSGEKTGLEMVLKVMSGDKVFIRGESFYNLTNGNSGSTLPMALADLLASFVGSSPVLGKGVTAGQISSLNNNAAQLGNFLNQNNPGSTTAKAAINWILLDEQFNYVAADLDAVQTGGGYKNHTKFINNPVNVSRSGYLYIYVSNESNLQVYFDNLQVTHNKSPILETTDYYPFGLTMAGISSKAAGGIENRKKFNGIEQTTELDLNQYDAFYRTMDPQTGRWWQIDPKPESALLLSPYVSMNNNPISLTDPLGDIIEYERERNKNDKKLDVSRRELRQFRRDIRDMRRNSASFNKMYKDMQRSSQKFVYKASSTQEGGNTAKPWDPDQNGVTTIKVNVRMSQNKVIQTTAHETGHGWRIAQGLDVQPEYQSLPSMPGIQGTDKDMAAYNRKRDWVVGENNIVRTEARKKGELGAMHISNIVMSELERSGNRKYENPIMETTYFGPAAVPAKSLFNNPTYEITQKDYINISPLTYYNQTIDIHHEHGVKPIQ
ncbi:MAG: DUF6443 domain-containing protein [Candidatus Pseudobacter hemicellulosilyticus]|uniref:DUF6443 domain-containing protein n=1 Tax=Candidatus Pseudobacter hemicellulosilyticus TaxID=3121375 RepID=A0AAJ6BH63_9BACT|nr:MAG: DUF6443 domain-containing protein [Pseudobacter sp.]